MTSSTPTTRCTPALGRAAEEIAPGILTMISVASVNAIDTGDGLVMLDTGGQFDSDHVYDQVRGWRPEAPVRAAVYSHHHIDHVFGTRRFEAEAAERGWPPPVVYAHEDLPDHFRRYERTLGWNAAINKRQFALPVDRFDWPADYRYPDVTYRDHLTFTQGGLTFELHHARGETDDATWTFVPELRRPPPRRPVHLGGAERRQPAEGAALRQRLGGGAAADGRRAAPRSCCAGTACRSSAPIGSARRSPTPPSCSTRSRPRRSR